MIENQEEAFLQAADNGSCVKTDVRCRKYSQIH